MAETGSKFPLTRPVLSWIYRRSRCSSFLLVFAQLTGGPDMPVERLPGDAELAA